MQSVVVSNDHKMSTAILQQLTQVERLVYDGIISGLTNKEIGEQLGSTERTVKFHTTNVLKKARVRSRTQLAVLDAAEKQLVVYHSAASKLLRQRELFEEAIEVTYKQKEEALLKKIAGYRNAEQIKAAWPKVLQVIGLHIESAAGRQLFEALIKELGL